MLSVKGKLVFIQQVPAKTFDGKVSEPYQKLQLQIIDPEKGFTIVEVKDKDFRYKKDDVNKELELPVSAYSTHNIYYSVA